MNDLITKMIERGQINLKEILIKHQIDDIVIKKIINSGYYYFKMYAQEGYILDSFTTFNLFPSFTIDFLKKIINGQEKEQRKIPEYTINNIAEGEKIFEDIKLKFNPTTSHRLLLRGATREYFIEREFPNPFYSENGKEISLIPSIYRQYAPTYKQRDFYDSSRYYDSFLSDSRNHIEYNETKINIMQQHYGIPTVFFDYTLDFATAAFFALNKYSKDKKKYLPIQKENYKDSIIYVMRPYATKSACNMIEEYSCYGIRCVRPYRQKCTVLSAHGDHINVATKEVVARIRISEKFNILGIPSYEYLFPTPEEDPMYSKLLEYKKKGIPGFEDIIEYY